jgi:phage terminase large subunit
MSRLHRAEAKQDNGITLTMNDAYIPLFNDAHRVNAIKGGSGSGKSVFEADRIIVRALTLSKRNTLIVRKVARTNRLSTFPLILNRLYSLGVFNRFTINKTDMRMICVDTGNEIVFEGMDDSEKIKSITFSSGPLTDVWMEEATEFEEDDFIQLNLRLRGKGLSFQITLTFNPVSVGHWIKKRFFDNPKPNVVTLTTTYKDNHFLDPEYANELEALKHTDPILYQIYCEGEWGEAGDIVFGNVVFEPCKYKEEDFDEVLCGMDFGYNHYHAIEKIGIKDGELYSFRELYVRQKTNSSIIAMNEEMDIINRSVICTADSAEPKSIQDWNDAGYRNVKPAKKGPDSVYAQVQFLRSHRWHVDPEQCPGLVGEIRGYVYHKDKNGKVDDHEPIGFHDDAIAACRYAIERKLTPMKKSVITKVEAA